MTSELDDRIKRDTRRYIDALLHDTEPATPLHTSDSAVRPMTSRPKRLAAMAACLMALIGLGAGLWLAGRPSPPPSTGVKPITADEAYRDLKAAWASYAKACQPPPTDPAPDPSDPEASALRPDGTLRVGVGPGCISGRIPANSPGGRLTPIWPENGGTKVIGYWLGGWISVAQRESPRFNLRAYKSAVNRIYTGKGKPAYSMLKPRTATYNAGPRTISMSARTTGTLRLGTDSCVYLYDGQPGTRQLLVLPRNRFTWSRSGKTLTFGDTKYRLRQRATITGGTGSDYHREHSNIPAGCDTTSLWIAAVPEPG